MTYMCAVCGIEFTPLRAKGRHRYCSRKCARRAVESKPERREYMRAYQRQPEQRAKRAAYNHAYMTPERRRKYQPLKPDGYVLAGRGGRAPWNKGRTAEADARIAKYAVTQSQARKGKRPEWLKPPIRRGPANNKWKGGVTSSEQLARQGTAYRTWRRAVLERDGCTCQRCGQQMDKDLCAHHIYDTLEYPERRYDVDNGVALCRSCHMTLHGGGFRWLTLEQRQELKKIPHPLPVEAHEQ